MINLLIDKSDEKIVILSGSKNGKNWAKSVNLKEINEEIEISVSENILRIAGSFFQGIREELKNDKTTDWIKKNIHFKNNEFQEKFLKELR